MKAKGISKRSTIRDLLLALALASTFSLVGCCAGGACASQMLGAATMGGCPNGSCPNPLGGAVSGQLPGA